LRGVFVLSEKARKQFMEITGVEVPKRTIMHSFVQEIGSKLKEEQQATLSIEREEAPAMIVVPVLADRTKTHSIYETNNDVKVAMKYDQSTKEKRFLSIGLKQWMGRRERQS
jgi:hypothetical protein